MRLQTSTYTHTRKTLSLLGAMIMFFVICACDRNIGNDSVQQKEDNKKVETFVNNYSLSPSGELEPTSGAAEGSIPLADTAKKTGNVYVVHLQQGTGTTPTTKDRVSILYRGYLMDNMAIFDSATDPQARSEVWLSGAIEGLQRGICDMKTSATTDDVNYPNPGKAYIIIPAYMAWGANGKTSPSVPENACLIYYVELYSLSNIAL